jgi:hypothetical protein
MERPVERALGNQKSTIGWYAPRDGPCSHTQRTSERSLAGGSPSGVLSVLLLAVSRSRVTEGRRIVRSCTGERRTVLPLWRAVRAVRRGSFARESQPAWADEAPVEPACSAGRRGSGARCRVDQGSKLLLTSPWIHPGVVDLSLECRTRFVSVRLRDQQVFGLEEPHDAEMDGATGTIDEIVELDDSPDGHRFYVWFDAPVRIPGARVRGAGFAAIELEPGAEAAP